MWEGFVIYLYAKKNNFRNYSHWLFRTIFALFVNVTNVTGERSPHMFAYAVTILPDFSMLPDPRFGRQIYVQYASRSITY